VKPISRAEYTEKDIFLSLLNACMPDNRRALELSLLTGLRIGDCLSIRREGFAQRMSIRESKTGKIKRISIPTELYERLLVNSGKYYIFEGRLSPKKHRTRSAVYKDLMRVCKIFRINGKHLAEHISPHSARKVYAVTLYKKTADIKKVQRLLNHSNEGVTMLYAMADILTKRHGIKQKEKNDV
jgi:integrase